MEQNSTLWEKRWTILGVLGFFSIFILCFLTFFPLINGIALGILLAYVAYPLHKRILGQGKHKSYAAMGALFIIIIPFSVLFMIGLYEFAQEMLSIRDNPEQFEEDVYEFLDKLGLEHDYYDRAVDWLTDYLTSIETITFIAFFLLDLIICIFVAFYLVRDGPNLKKSILEMFSGKKRLVIEIFIKRVNQAMEGLFVGHIFTAVLEGVIAGIVFYAFGVPLAFFCASLIVIAALMPIVGEWMVTLPLAGWLAYDQSVAMAGLFLAISSLTLIFMPQFLFKPIVAGKAAEMHPLLVLLGFIGGPLIFGISGFVLGPSFMALFLATHRTICDWRKCEGDGERYKKMLEECINCDKS